MGLWYIFIFSPSFFGSDLAKLLSTYKAIIGCVARRPGGWDALHFCRIRKRIERPLLGSPWFWDKNYIVYNLSSFLLHSISCVVVFDMYILCSWGFRAETTGKRCYTAQSKQILWIISYHIPYLTQLHSKATRCMNSTTHSLQPPWSPHRLWGPVIVNSSYSEVGTKFVNSFHIPHLLHHSPLDIFPFLRHLLDRATLLSRSD